MCYEILPRCPGRDGVDKGNYSTFIFRLNSPLFAHSLQTLQRKLSCILISSLIFYINVQPFERWHSRVVSWSIVPSSHYSENERDGVSNHRRLDCLLSRLFKPRSKKTPKLRVTSLCEGNSPMTGEFPAQRASNAENVSIRWRHHVLIHTWQKWVFYRRVQLITCWN